MLLSNTEVEAPDFTMLGYAQADLHRRQANEERAEQNIKAHARLIMRFTPFILATDQNTEPVALMETVAKRLMIAAQEERQRRIEVCPEGFEHLVAA